MKSTFDGKTKLKEALDSIPGALEYIVSLNPHDFSRLNNPVMRKYMSPRITLARVAAMARIPENDLLDQLNRMAGNEIISADANRESSPLPQSPQEKPVWLTDDVPLRIIDVMEIDDAVGDPMPPIMSALRRLQPGEVGLLKHRWEPQPLYDIWSKTGIEWFTIQVAEMEWHVYVHRPLDVTAWKKEETVLILLDHLNPDEIAPRCKAVFDQLNINESLEIRARSKVLLTMAQERIQPPESTFDTRELPIENDKIGILITRR